MDIDISKLTKTYRGGLRALDSIDLHIPTGMFGLLGANGAGKTTLMRILAGILPASEGRIFVGGHDLGTPRGRTEVKRRLGYLPQELGLYPDLSGHEFLDYIAILKGISDPNHRRRRVEEVTEQVALTDAAHRKLKTYSGGMKRRVGIAQALLNDPALLIVDEPTAGLDPEERIRFRLLLSDLTGDRTVLLSTHIVEDVAQSCPRVAVLAKGRVLFAGPTTEVVDAARGQVWIVTTDGRPPAGDLAIVSAVQRARGVEYRVVAASAPGPDAEPAEATLEDGYLALMRRHGGLTTSPL